MSETIIRIKKRFEEENISIAYSVTTLDCGVKEGVNLFDNPVNVQSSKINF
jgi:small conductance mechanosensitive channel